MWTARARRIHVHCSKIKTSIWMLSVLFNKGAPGSAWAPSLPIRKRIVEIINPRIIRRIGLWTILRFPRYLTRRMFLFMRNKNKSNNLKVNVRELRNNFNKLNLNLIGKNFKISTGLGNKKSIIKKILSSWRF